MFIHFIHENLLYYISLLFIFYLHITTFHFYFLLYITLKLTITNCHQIHRKT